MKNLLTFAIAIFVLQVNLSSQSNSSAGVKRLNLPMTIPPQPSFSSLSNKNGKYKIITGEYYSSDTKPFLYKRLIKFDTTTGEAWVLQSKLGSEGETRKWIPLETE